MHCGENYAGDSVTADRGSNVGQDKGQVPDKEGYAGPPGWGLCETLEAPT